MSELTVMSVVAPEVGAVSVLILGSVCVHVCVQCAHAHTLAAGTGNVPLTVWACAAVER